MLCAAAASFAAAVAAVVASSTAATGTAHCKALTSDSLDGNMAAIAILAADMDCQAGKSAADQQCALHALQHGAGIADLVNSKSKTWRANRGTIEQADPLSFTGEIDAPHQGKMHTNLATFASTLQPADEGAMDLTGHPLAAAKAEKAGEGGVERADPARSAARTPKQGEGAEALSALALSTAKEGAGEGAREQVDSAGNMEQAQQMSLEEINSCCTRRGGFINYGCSRVQCCNVEGVWQGCGLRHDMPPVRTLGLHRPAWTVEADSPGPSGYSWYSAHHIRAGACAPSTAIPTAAMGANLLAALLMPRRGQQ